MATSQPASPSSPSRALSVEKLLCEYADSDFQKFNIFFRKMRVSYPEDCTRGCLQYLAGTADPQVARQMTLWLCSGVDYIGQVFDPELSSVTGTTRLAIALRDSDAQFFTKLSRFLQDPRILKPASLIARVLALVPALGECGILIPWLRSLEGHPEEQIRLQSAKAMCQLRPTRAMVERLLQSPEPQTRAAALEAYSRDSSAEARTVFHFALSDPDHRVVATALTGLHLNGETNFSVEKMIQLARHKSAMFRSSIAAVMAKIGDDRCVPTLKLLTTDPYPVVRQAAQAALQVYALRTPEPEVTGTESNPGKSSEAAVL